MINICIYMYSLGKGTLFQGRRDTLFFWKRDVLPPWNNFFLWESDHLSPGNRTIYPLGIGPFTLCMGIGPLILWEMGHGKRDTLSSGIRITYSVGNILWESGIWEMKYKRSFYLTEPSNVYTLPNLPPQLIYMEKPYKLHYNCIVCTDIIGLCTGACGGGGVTEPHTPGIFFLRKNHDEFVKKTQNINIFFHRGLGTRTAFLRLLLRSRLPFL